MKIAVIGAGWLGLPLCEKLKSKGITVLATKRTAEDAEQVTYNGVDAFAYSLGDEALPGPLTKCHLYIINIGAGRGRFDKDVFAQQMKTLIALCLDDKRKKLIFVSTTSVYGERVREVKEDAQVEPISASAQAHVAIEDFLFENFASQCTILRLAGLVSEDRHPAVHFEGKKDVTQAHRMVNLVHRDDAIAAIEKIIEKKMFGRIFHLCSSEHPTRKDYYCWAAEQMELVPPEFLGNTEQPATGKKVDASDSIEALGLELKYDSPYKMVEAKPSEED
jgi:nucleoside-diphosphate-sugar epimerase